MIKVKLDSVKKFRNKNEWRTVPRASALGETVITDGYPIRLLAEKLIANGCKPDDLCEVYRGGTLCFHARALSQWASGTANTGKQPEQLASP